MLTMEESCPAFFWATSGSQLEPATHAFNSRLHLFALFSVTDTETVFQGYVDFCGAAENVHDDAVVIALIFVTVKAQEFCQN